MMIPPAWFCHTATRKAQTGRGTDVRATPTYGSAEPVACRIERRVVMRRDQQGREVQCQWEVAVPEEVAPLLSDQWWFPSILGEPADDTASIDAARSPVAIRRATDMAGGRGFHLISFG
jgi:hypothetical protein